MRPLESFEVMDWTAFARRVMRCRVQAAPWAGCLGLDDCHEWDSRLGHTTLSMLSHSRLPACPPPPPTPHTLAPPNNNARTGFGPWRAGRCPT